MSEKKNQPEPASQNTEGETKTLLAASRRVLLAAIGAVALAQDEIEDFVNRLVERGEIAEKDGKSLVHEVMERRDKRAHEVEERANQLFQDTLKRMNIPSKKDIEELGDKIAALSKKVEALHKD